MTAFSYWISPGLHLLNTNRSADISSKLNCWEWLVESETKTSAVTWQHANYHSWNSVKVQCFPGFTRIKLSNTADWYMWNFTDILPDQSCVDMTYPDNMLAGLEGLTATLPQCAVKQWEYFAFNLGGSIINMVKYCQTVRPERLWPRPNIYGHAWQKIYQTTCFIFCYLGGYEIHTDFLMRYQPIENKGFII